MIAVFKKYIYIGYSKFNNGTLFNNIEHSKFNNVVILYMVTLS